MEPVDGSCNLDVGKAEVLKCPQRLLALIVNYLIYETALYKSE
jgi:hypothetical protein